MSATTTPIFLNLITEAANVSKHEKRQCGESLEWIQMNVEHLVYLVKIGICCTGFLLNLITFIVFTRSVNFKGAPYVFMAALAFTDMATLIFKIPECFVMAYRGNHITGQYIRDIRKMSYYIYTNILNYMCNVTENISVWLIVCLALERYIAMKHFNISKTKCNSANAIIILVAMSCAALMQNCFFFFGTGAIFKRDENGSFVTGYKTAFYYTNWYTVLSWFRASMAQFVPLIFMIIINLRLIVGLHNQRKKMEKYVNNNGRCKQHCSLTSTNTSVIENLTNNAEPRSNSKKRHSSYSIKRQMAQRRLTIMLILVICVVLFGQIPQAFSFHSLFSILFNKCNNCELDKCQFYRVYKLTANFLNLLSYSCNFFIYFGLNKYFRDFLCCRNKNSASGPASLCTMPLYNKVETIDRHSPPLTPNNHNHTDKSILITKLDRRRLSSGLSFIDDSEREETTFSNHK